MRCIVWFRQDLRLHDNPALHQAIASGAQIIPVFILEDTKNWKPGGASRWWLHKSLEDLNKSLGGNLILRQGTASQVLSDLIRQTHATAVFWNRRYSLEDINTDKAIKAELERDNIIIKSFNSHLLFEPWEIKTNQHSFFQVFTPFWKKCLTQPARPTPLPTPTNINFSKSIEEFSVKDLNLLPIKPDWTGGLRKTWIPGETGAQMQFEAFLNHLKGYKENRNRADLDATSRLSPHLTWGELSVRQLWHTVLFQISQTPCIETDAWDFLSEIGWREFSYHVLYYQPTLPKKPLKSKFEKFPWHQDPGSFQLWTKGLTGYPIVDAGMRQLWQTGFMHNRIRMIVASFLIKDLVLPWQDGAAWFWDTLVDADLANNSASWQWVAGCGVDASPYFRIFNPILQGKKFDPDGVYVKKWIPELRHLPNEFIHQPWKSKPLMLKEAGIELGKTYPHPIVDHAQARIKALELYKKL